VLKESVDWKNKYVILVSLCRGVPIIGSAWHILPLLVSVQNNGWTDIATDVYTAANSLQINRYIDFYIIHVRSWLVAVAYCSLYSKCYATRSHTNMHDSSVCCWKVHTY